jgi:hypothetical protein
VPRRLVAVPDDGPKLKGTQIPADFHYYNWWIKKHLWLRRRHAVCHRLELGRCWRSTRRQEWTTLRVPYPLGFYRMNGRIDDANARWKGARYANYSTHFVAHRGRKGHEGQGRIPGRPIHWPDKT